MGTDHTLEQLNRAAAAAGFAMATDDDLDFKKSSRPAGDEVARGARTPTAQQALAVLQGSSATQRTPAISAPANALVAGANTVRATVYGYLGLGAVA